jgi:hypothetical protein
MKIIEFESNESNELLIDSPIANSSSFSNIPNIYNLQNFKEMIEDINLRIIIHGRNIYKMYLDDIELFYIKDDIENYIEDDTFYKVDNTYDKNIADNEGNEYINFNTYIDLEYILSSNNIFDKKKYIFLKYCYIDTYFTTDIELSSPIILSSKDIFCQKIRNKSIFNKIMIREIELYIDLNDINESATREKFININLKQHIIGINNPSSNAFIYKLHDYSSKDKKIIFLDRYFIPIFLKINISLKENKNNKNIEDNLLNSTTECNKIKNIILPLHFKNAIGEVYCELYLENTTNKLSMYRLYFTKIILPNNEIISYRNKCQKCIKSKLNINIFNEYDNLCNHKLNNIGFYLKKYIEQKIIINISDLVEEFDKLKNNSFFIMLCGREIFF